MKSILVPIFVTGFLLTIFSYRTWSEDTPQNAEQQNVKKWEHLALSRDAAKGLADGEFSRQINELGMAGWELVDVENFTENGSTTKTVYFFKRPKVL